MTSRIKIMVLVSCCFVLLSATGQQAPSGRPEAPGGPPLPGRSAPAGLSSPVRAIADFGRMPLSFIPNKGQVNGPVAYYVQGKDATLYFTSEGLTYVLAGHVLKLDFVGARAGVVPVGAEKADAVVSYFRGRPEDWRSGLPTYSKIVYEGLWPGIDLAYYGTADRLKYEFIVHPGADPGQIRLAYRGVEGLAIDPAGRLEVSSAAGRFEDDVPAAYQEIDGRRVSVPLSYALSGQDGGNATGAVGQSGGGGEAGEPAAPRAYGFNVGEYDEAEMLVLDPAILMYSGYVGGINEEKAYGIAVDAAGSAYITGSTRSTQATFPVSVGPDLTHGADAIDAFVAKVKPDGSGLAYCGYIGGGGSDYGYCIAVDTAGCAYVVGHTMSSQAQGFPVLVGPDLTNAGSEEGWIAKVNAAGSALVYCGYIGGGAEDRAGGVAVDGSGNAYVVGQTRSAETNSFPVTVGPDLTHNSGSLYDAFIAKVNAAGSGFAYCGFLGGANSDYGKAVAVDAAGNAYLTGQTVSPETSFPVSVGPDLTFNSVGLDDAFVAKVNASGLGLDYCGYIGGSSYDYGYGIAVDAAGCAYIGGSTSSTQTTFPEVVGPDLTYSSNQDGFVAKVAADGATLVYCGYVGGTDVDYCYALAVDGSGNAYLAGATGSATPSFPVISGPDYTHNGVYDGYVAKVNAGGTALLYCGYVGGSGADYAYGVAVDSQESAYITGYSAAASTNFPVWIGPDLTANGDNDVFVTKLVSPFAVSHHAVGDFDGDTTDELAVDFGASGAYLYDNSAWSLLTSFNTESLRAADVDGDGADEIIMDLGTLGLYLWDGGAASQLSGVNVDVYAAGDVDADGSAEFAGDFGPAGLWLYDGGAWTQLSGVNADYLHMADLDGSGGEELVGDFGPTGMWIWNAGAWTQLSGVNADYMTSGNTDAAGGQDLVGDFSATGMWLYSNALWTQLSGVNVEQTLIAAVDLSGDDIIGDFGQTGLWLWNGTTWAIMSGVNSEQVIRANIDSDANDELAVDFGALGLWLIDGGAWTLLSGQNPEALFAGDLDGDSQEELLADLGALGLWRWQAGTWTQISSGNPQ